MICQICMKEIDSLRCLSKHIRDCHKMPIKEYYDKFMKKDGEGICLVCKKETKWRSIGEGYVRTCGHVCGCTHHRHELRNNEGKMKIFVKKVSVNQKNIWKKRELSGEKNIICNKTIVKNKINAKNMTREERCKRFGWLNALPEVEKSKKIKEILELSLVKFYKEATDEEKRKIIEKRLITRIKNGTMSDPNLRDDFDKYSRLVRSKTATSYRKYKHIIDPDNLKGRSFHLDHKVSVLFGFLNNIPEEFISHYLNLEIITSKCNLEKHAKCSMIVDDLISSIKGNK